MLCCNEGYVAVLRLLLDVVMVGIGVACAAMYCLLQEEVASNMCELIQSTTLRQELRVAALYVGNMDAGNVTGRGPVTQFHKYVRFARNRLLLDV